MEEQDIKYYIEQLDQGFAARVLAYSGDGIIKGIGELKNENCRTVECEYKGEKHFFIFESETIYLLPESKIGDLNAVVAFDKSDPTAITALQQLITNPWIEPSFNVSDYI